jgi:sugar fermentation stimulation protein A
MKCDEVTPARFLRRPNRFIAVVETEAGEETVHVKNTGRCRELLIPESTVWLSAASGERKTKYDLVAVEKQRQGQSPLLINMDSQAPNEAVAEWLPRSGWFSSEAVIYREKRYGDSRFDFYVEEGRRKAFIEVKGVTLEQDGIARFPDAPTLRGVKHVGELMDCVSRGYEAYILFVIQMKGVRLFCPNDDTHPRFGDVLREAAASGVHVSAVDCVVTPDTMVADAFVPVRILSH